MCQGQFERTLNSFEQVLAKKFANNTQHSFMIKVAACKIWRESIEGNSFSILSKVLILKVIFNLFQDINMIFEFEFLALLNIFWAKNGFPHL